MEDIRVATKLINLKNSAKDRGIVFKVSFRKLKQLMRRKTCYYTGVPFEENGENALSIDRVDNDKGYIDSNIVACTVRINRFKNNFTVREFKRLNTKLNDFLNKK